METSRERGECPREVRGCGHKCLWEAAVQQAAGEKRGRRQRDEPGLSEEGATSPFLAATAMWECRPSVARADLLFLS